MKRNALLDPLRQQRALEKLELVSGGVLIPRHRYAASGKYSNVKTADRRDGMVFLTRTDTIHGA
jgi:hypothetical protein